MKKGIILLICGIFGVGSMAKAVGLAQEYTHNQQRDSLISRPIYFRLGSSIIDPAFEQNKEVLSHLGLIFADTTIVSHLDSVCVTATSSPDGNYSDNNALAFQRSQAVKSYIVKNYPQIAQDKIVTHSYVENWTRLRSMISATTTPYYSQIVSVLDRRLSPQATESQLKAIDAGKAWTDIVYNYLPKLRSEATYAIYGHIASAPPTVKVEEPAQESTPEVLMNQPIPVVEQIIAISPEPMRRPLFALKTNLLYDAMTALNLEIEVPIGQHWSVGSEFIFPWWLSERKERCLQSLSVYVEGRYWFGDRNNRRQLTGWFAGLYAGGGNYDVQWGDKGYQGKFCIPIALSGGYAHTIGRNLSMEYSLGIGYMRTSYSKYDSDICVDDEQRLIRQSSGTYNWIGPTRAKVSLVWMINSKKK